MWLCLQATRGTPARSLPAARVALVPRTAASCHPSSCLRERRLAHGDTSRVSTEQQRRKCKRLRARPTNGGRKTCLGILGQGWRGVCREVVEASNELDCLSSSGEDTRTPPLTLAEAVSSFPYTPLVCLHPSCVFLEFVSQDKGCILFCVHHLAMQGSR